MSNINQLVLENLEKFKPTSEMFEFYKTRTNNHIKRVQNNLSNIFEKQGLTPCI